MCSNTAPTRILTGKDIICLASSSYYSPSWVNVQHIMSRLAGPNRILYVESVGLRSLNLRGGHDLKRMIQRFNRFFKGPDQAKSNLWVLSPIGIPFWRSRTQRLNSWLLKGQIARLAKRLQFQRPIVWTFLPVRVELLECFKPACLIYHCVDDYAANPGVNTAKIEQDERHLLAYADVVFTTSRPLFEKTSRLNSNTHYVPNVADISVFQSDVPPHPAVTAIRKGPRIGYVGNIADYKIDIELLNQLVEAQPNWQFVMVGPIGLGDPKTTVSALEARPNVTFMGEVPRQVVPQYVAGFDVCLIPFRLSRLTTHSFPMKFHEFLAMGKPVVATDLPALSELHNYFYPCRTSEDFLHGIKMALEEDGTQAANRIQVAQLNSWSQRMKDISAAIQVVLANQHPR